MLMSENGGTGAGAEGDPKVGTETIASKNPVEPGDDKEALRRMGEQRDAAREEARKAAEERDALKAEKTQREAAEQRRKDKEAAESGKWEELATKREADLTAATAEVARLTSENGEFRAAMADGLDALVKSVPKHVHDLLNDTVPKEDDVLPRWRWLHKPSVQDLIKAAGEAPEISRANGGLPKSSAAAATRSVEDEAKALNQSGTYAM